MKKVIAIIFLSAIAVGIKAQFIMPSFVDTAEAELNPVDTQAVRAIIQDQVQTQSQPEKPRGVEDDDSVRAQSIRLKKLEIQAQRLKLEKEIAALGGKGNLSPEEAEVLRLKNENLKLVLQRERMLLEQEIETAKIGSSIKNLPQGVVYGHQYFRDNAFITIQKTSEIIPTENYILGTGDLVQLEVWGDRYWSKSYMVSESGSIDLVGYQKLFVKGLSLKQVRELIGSRLALNGSSSSFSVAVTRPRQVTVNILGEVFKPGSYTLPATNTVFNALISMGGPSNIGSVRNIYIKRDGKIRDSFDLYEYFKDIRHQRDVYLQNNDYILVMPLNNYVNINGSVRRPGNYEMKAGEGLKDLIAFAGGTHPNTYLKDVLVSRIHDNKYEVISINLDSIFKLKKDFKLLPGDNVYFKELRMDNQYTVLVSGSVSVPGTYFVKNGMRISDLIKNANGYTSDAYLEKAYLIRTNNDLSKSYYNFSPEELMKTPGIPSDIKVENRDSIFIFSKNAIMKFYNVAISGSVYKPNSFSYINGLNLGELLFMAGGLTPDADSAMAYIVRTNADNDRTLIPFKPSDVVNKTGFDKFELLPRDVVTIYSRNSFKNQFSLAIQGSVKSPVNMTYTENTRISDMIKMAGGLQLSAYKGRALLITTDIYTKRNTVKTFNPMQIITNENSPQNIILPKNAVIRIFDQMEVQNGFDVSIFGEVKTQGNFDYADNMTVQNLIDMAGGFNFISAGTSVELVRNFYMENGSYQFLKPRIYMAKVSDKLILDTSMLAMNLQPFDRIFVRRNPDFMPLKMVYIGGAVRYPGAYALSSENEKLASIYTRAGGFRPDADLNGIKVKRVRSSGDTLELVLNSRKAIHRRHSKYNVILREGDYIYVPYAENLVTISGDINKLTQNDLAVYYTRHKRARYYIRNFGGGFNPTSDKRNVVVIKANGARKATRHFLFFKIYPKVKPGSKIIVTSKVEQAAKSKGGSKSSLNVDVFLNKLLTRATAILSLMGIYKIATSK